MIVIAGGLCVAMVAIMAIGWLFQRATGNGGWTDVFWTWGTGLTCAVAALIPLHPGSGVTWRQVTIAALVALWSIRLGTYIALRVTRSREDVRYALLRARWGAAFQRRMFGLMIVQAPVTAIFGVAILFAAHQSHPGFRAADLLGILILSGCIAGEALADRQMKLFKATPRNEGKICDQGLWAWSRHPNYFFEALSWVAYSVIGFDPDHAWSLMAFLAPAVMFAVLRYGTGIPPLEAAMLRSKGDAYRHYQERVSILIPWPPKRR
jgi:steroid 5-alpha reductase family enzyme